MTSHKQRDRARRQVERTMRDAFAAIDGREFALADKLSRRAVETGFMNPRIWRDRGRVARACGDLVAAEAALRHALVLAPTFAAARLELAELLVDDGRVEAARAVLDAGLALRVDVALQAARDALGAAPAAEVVTAVVAATSAPDFSALTERYDWAAVAASLTATGVARLPRFVESAGAERWAACAEAAAGSVFERADDDVRATWFDVAEPAPPGLDAVRSELFARLAPIARAHAMELARPAGFADALAAFVAAHGRGDRASLARVVVPDAGGIAPQADPDARFPFACIVALGPVHGVVHVLRDRRPGRREHARRTRLAVGDALLFAARERRIEIAGVAARQDVAVGIEAIDGRGAGFLAICFEGRR